MMSEMKQSPLVEVNHLKKYFNVGKNRFLHAVDDVSFTVAPGETLGLVGESGCGKSTVGNLAVNLLAPDSGQVLFRGQNVHTSRGTQAAELKKKIQLIFQDPYSSLNPAKTIYQILSEAFLVNGVKKGPEMDRRIHELIEMTGLEEYLLGKFPHELDGGRRQMVGIVRCLSMNPEFIVCDEPVSALDVSVQATIINLLMDMQEKLGIAYLFISHDLSVVKHISHRIAVMYLGQIVEIADKETIFRNTLHPYSIALLSAVPNVDFENQTSRIVLKGDVPSPVNPAPGCRFAGRCWMAGEKCFQENPALQEMEEGHFVACHYCRQSREKYADLLQEMKEEN